MKIPISTQPNCISCGPTSLHSVYKYWGDAVSLEDVIANVPYLETGGTLNVLLGCDALRRGYGALLHSFNLQVLDPTWFKRKHVNLLEKLQEQSHKTTDTKIKQITEAYIQFLTLGGVIDFSDIHFDSIRSFLDKKQPILTGVSATYFYQNMRDYTNEDDRAISDEWLGAPSGHFIVIEGYDDHGNLCIADPYTPHPLSREHHYTTSFMHWLHAHLLGVTSNDAEYLVIQKNAQNKSNSSD